MHIHEPGGGEGYNGKNSQVSGNLMKQTLAILTMVPPAWGEYHCLNSQSAGNCLKCVLAILPKIEKKFPL